jgi:hypothetical protein
MNACVALINVTNDADFNKLMEGQYVHVDGSTFTPFTKDASGMKGKDAYTNGTYFVVGNDNMSAIAMAENLNKLFAPAVVVPEVAPKSPVVQVPVTEQQEVQVAANAVPEDAAANAVPGAAASNAVPGAAASNAEADEKANPAADDSIMPGGGKSSKKSRKSAKKQRKLAKKQHKSAKKQRKSRSSRRSKK